MAALVVLALPIFWLANQETTGTHYEESTPKADEVVSRVDLSGNEIKPKTDEPPLVLQSTETPQFPDQANLAQTLEGTEIDGGLKTDATGQLILDQEVRDFFDYFLSTADEEKFTYRRGQEKLGFSEGKHFDITSGYIFTLLKFPGIQRKEAQQEVVVRNDAGKVVRKSRKVKRISNDVCKRSYTVGKTYRLLAVSEGEHIFRNNSSWTREVSDEEYD